MNMYIYSSSVSGSWVSNNFNQKHLSELFQNEFGLEEQKLRLAVYPKILKLY